MKERYVNLNCQTIQRWDSSDDPQNVNWCSEEISTHPDVKYKILSP